MADRTEIEKKMRQAAELLSDQALFFAGDTLTMRVPELNKVAMLSHYGALEWSAPNPDGSTLQRIYSYRPDVGAALQSGMGWLRAMHEMAAPMPAVFDEQVRHLGRGVPVFEKTANEAVQPKNLAGTTNAVVFSDTSFCLGMGLERLVLNVELLEKCAKAFVLAKSTGQTVRQIPFWVQLIADGRLKKDERKAAEHHARGEFSVLAKGY